MGDFTIYHIGEADLKYIREMLERSEKYITAMLSEYVVDGESTEASRRSRETIPRIRACLTMLSGIVRDK